MQYIHGGSGQRSPASSLCKQLWLPIPLWVQSTSLVSLLLHTRLSRRMGPVPWPKGARERAWAPREQNELLWSKTYIDATYTYHQTVLTSWPNSTIVFVFLIQSYICTLCYATALMFTSCIESQLSASHYCIKRRPGVITHSAPGLIPTNFHAAFIGGCSTHQSDVPILACH